MTLKEKLAGDLKAAMKAKETIRLETVRMLSAALKEREIEKRGSGNPVAPEDELAVLSSAAKKRKESIDLILRFVHAKQQGLLTHLFVMGCLSQRYEDQLRKEIPEIKEVVAID